MTAEYAERCVIRPMLAAFPAPHHVRGNAEATEALLNVYRRALAPFDAPVLRQAWQKAAAEQTFWVWPLPDDLVQAAEFFQRQMRRDDAWVEKASEMVDGYLKKFMKSTAAVRAREHGYEAELREYVKECAHVQSQYALGREGIGYSAAMIFQPGEGTQERDEFFRACREQAQTGQIKVTVSRALVKKWREEARGEERGPTR